MQLHPPGPPVGALCPAIRQPGLVVARRVDLDEPLLHGVVLDVVIGRPVDPGAHVVQVRRDQPHHQAVHFGLARRLRTRGRGGNQEQDRQQHNVAERANLPNVFSLHGSIPPCSPGLKVLDRWLPRRWDRYAPMSTIFPLRRCPTSPRCSSVKSGQTKGVITARREMRRKRRTNI